MDTTLDADVGGCRTRRTGGAHAARQQSLILETLAELLAVPWNTGHKVALDIYSRKLSRAAARYEENAGNREK